MRVRSFLIGILILLFASAYAATPRNIGVAEDPGDIGMGARPIGMGRAFVAIADDENAIFVNPAGLSFVTRPCLTSMYTSLLSDVNYLVIGFTYPFALFKNGGVGVGYIQSGVPGIISTSQSGFSMTDYYSKVLILGASFMPSSDLSLGGSLKLFYQGFSGTVNYAGTGSDIDLGLKWAMDKKLSLGVNLKNIIPLSLGGKISWPNGDEQSNAAIAKIGLKVLTDDKKLTLAFDSDIQMERPLPSTQHLGVEWGIHPNLSLRAGIDQSLNAATGGLGSNITFGVGLNITSLKLDYSYHPYFDESSNTTHYISVTYMFPEPAKKASKEAVALTNTATAESLISSQAATAEIGRLTAEAVVLKPVVATAEMVTAAQIITAEAQMPGIEDYVPKPVIQKVPKTGIVPQVASYSTYRVITRSFITKGLAVEEGEKLKSAGVETYILPISQDQWTVQIGNFRVLNNAEKAKYILELKGFPARIIEYKHFVSQ